MKGQSLLRSRGHIGVYSLVDDRQRHSFCVLMRTWTQTNTGHLHSVRSLFAESAKVTEIQEGACEQ